MSEIKKIRQVLMPALLIFCFYSQPIDNIDNQNIYFPSESSKAHYHSLHLSNNLPLNSSLLPQVVIELAQEILQIITEFFSNM